MAEGAVLSIFRVPPELAGQRLDVFLQGQLRRTSRTRTQFIVRNSAFDVQGKRLRPNHRVRAEEHVLLWRPPWDEDPVPTHVPILHEDEHLFAVDKPALLPVHPTARYHRNTLIRVLEGRSPGRVRVARSPARSRDERRAHLLAERRVRPIAQEADRGPHGHRQDIPRDHLGRCRTRHARRSSRRW